MKKAWVILVVAIAVLVCIFAIWTNTSSTPASVPEPTVSKIEVYGKITNLSNDPQEITLTGDDNKTYKLSIASSTEVLRDQGGTVGGTFGFKNLKVGDRVGFRGYPNTNGTVDTIVVVQYTWSPQGTP